MVIQGTFLYPGIAKGIAKKRIRTLQSDQTTESMDQRLVLSKALEASETSLLAEMETMKQTFPHHVQAMFEAHRLMIHDPFILERVENYLQAGRSAFESYQQAAKEVIELFEQVDDFYMRNRVVDIMDVTDRILGQIQDVEVFSQMEYDEPVILLVDQLRPSEMAKLSNTMVCGVLVEEANLNQHGVLFFDTLKIPCAIIHQDIHKINNNDTIIINSENRSIVIIPSIGGQTREL